MEQVMAQKDELMRKNALELLLEDLLGYINCETVVLIPGPGTNGNDNKVLPRLIVQRDTLAQTDAKKEKMRLAIENATDWKCTEETPAGQCILQAKPIKIDDVFLDNRFKAMKRSLDQISMLCVPIFDDTSNGSPQVVAVIKCTNKMSFSGRSSGIPFTYSDQNTAVMYAKLLWEESQTFMKRRRASQALSAMGVKGIGAGTMDSLRKLSSGPSSGAAIVAEQVEVSVDDDAAAPAADEKLAKAVNVFAIKK